MSYEVKNNTGSLFGNDRKDNASQPDARGSCVIDGVDYWVSSWNKKTQDGKPWKSLAFQRKDAKPERPAQRPQAGYSNAPVQRPQPQRNPAGSGFDDMPNDVPW